MPNYKIEDTTIFDSQTVLNYNIKTLDSSLNVIAFVYTYANNPNALFDTDVLMSFQKQEVEFDSTLIPLKEYFKDINGIKVGYLKYLDQKKRRYIARVFFFKDKKRVIVWAFEKYQNETQNNFSMVDCLLENIKIN